MLEKQLTVPDVKVYVYNEGIQCPFCDSYNLDPQEIETDITQTVVCPDCGKTWKNIYQLVGIVQDNNEFIVR